MSSVQTSINVNQYGAQFSIDCEIFGRAVKILEFSYIFLNSTKGV